MLGVLPQNDEVSFCAVVTLSITQKSLTTIILFCLLIARRCEWRCPPRLLPVHFSNHNLSLPQDFPCIDSEYTHCGVAFFLPLAFDKCRDSTRS